LLGEQNKLSLMVPENEADKEMVYKENGCHSSLSSILMVMSAESSLVVLYRPKT
jgi:hypothetical protein